MVQTIQPKDISLYELEQKFSLKLAIEEHLFSAEELPILNKTENESLQRVRSNYFNLTKRRFMSEEAVKIVVLSPLLDLAGFYQLPFETETETAIEIAAEDEGLIVKGSIDVLVIQKQLWVLVIESKSTKFDVMTAMPQALAYMLNTPNTEQPTFGLWVNGREFVFLKLIKRNTPQYNFSRAFSIFKPENDLYEVLRVLKQIGVLLKGTES